MINCNAGRPYGSYARVQLLLGSRACVGQGWDACLAPPTTASVFALASTGYEAYEHCVQLATTPFPFPWAQMMILLLIMYSLTLPIMTVAYLTDVWAAVVLTFISGALRGVPPPTYACTPRPPRPPRPPSAPSSCAVLTYWSLNEVARDLEDAFVYPPVRKDMRAQPPMEHPPPPQSTHPPTQNELPLARLQHDFNGRLLAAAAVCGVQMGGSASNSYASGLHTCADGGARGAGALADGAV